MHRDIEHEIGKSKLIVYEAYNTSVKERRNVHVTHGFVYLGAPLENSFQYRSIFLLQLTGVESCAGKSACLFVCLSVIVEPKHQAILNLRDTKTRPTS